MKNTFIAFLSILICVHASAQEEKIWIDKNGNTVLPAGDYEDEEFEDVIIYREGNKYGMKNIVEEVKVHAQYDYAINIGKGFAAFAYQNADGTEGVWYLFNKTGKMIHGSPFKKIYTLNGTTEDKPVFHNGLLAVQSVSIGKVGCLDTEGHMAVPELYDYIKDLGDAVMYVGKNGEHGLLNKQTKVEILTKYDQIKEFSQGLAAVSKKGKWGYINEEGKEVIPVKFKSAGYFFADRASVTDEKGAKKFVNLKGELSDQSAYGWNTEISQVYENILVIKTDNQKSILFSRITGKALNGKSFTNSVSFVNGYAVAVDSANAVMLINTKGETVIKGYDGYGTMSEGLICAFKNENVKDASGKNIAVEKSGYLDVKGNVIIAFQYGGIGSFKNGIAVVSKFENYKNLKISKKKK
jgi:hypothetical protein